MNLPRDTGILNESFFSAASAPTNISAYLLALFGDMTFMTTTALLLPLLSAAPTGQPTIWLPVIVSIAVVAAIFAFNPLTQAGVIARATLKEAIRQPIFGMLMIVSIIILLVNTWVPFFSLGEDTKMYKDCGLATLLISSILLSVWTASFSISDEIEGKTAMTLLSKPINRRQFILGKYLGILQAVLWLLIPLTIAFLALTYYKVGYDSKESGATTLDFFLWHSQVLGPITIDWPLPLPERAVEVMNIIPGVILIFLETAVLAAISVVISTRLPMIVNMVACFAIFIVGHLTPVIVAATSDKPNLEFVPFVAQLSATVLPTLENFNMSAPIATGRMVPSDYLGFAAIYCLSYCCAAILLAFILFEDRDLA